MGRARCTGAGERYGFGGVDAHCNVGRSGLIDCSQYSQRRGTLRLKIELASGYVGEEKTTTTTTKKGCASQASQRKERCGRKKRRDVWSARTEQGLF